MPSSADWLPHVDEHSTAIEADAEAVWEAALRVVEGSLAPARASQVARLLGCAEVEASGLRPLAACSAPPSNAPSARGRRCRSSFSR